LALAQDAQALHQIDLDMPLGLVIGNEGDGLRRLVRDRCDFLAQLPMHGHVQSLNAAVAGSLALYAARAARARPARPRPANTGP
jgi:23S rRNA (guanosine2251-2'-O)-methyltransferase